MARKATVPIYDGDDFERMAELRREVEIAERKVKKARIESEESAAVLRVGDEDTSVEDAEAELAGARRTFTAFVDEAAERAENWVLVPIGHEEFRGLLKEHPARTVTRKDGDGNDVEVTHPDDAVFAEIGIDVNAATFPKALLTFVDPDDDEIRTVVEPVCESVEALGKRIKRLSAGEFEAMWLKAYFLNTGLANDAKTSDFYDGARRSAVI